MSLKTYPGKSRQSLTDAHIKALGDASHTAYDETGTAELTGDGSEDMTGNSADDQLNSVVGAKVKDAVHADDDIMSQSSPHGQFSKGSLNSLVSGLNTVLPSFGISDKYPSFSADETEFPAEFIRQISMVADAVRDAIDDGDINPDMAFSLSDIVDDRSIARVAGRLSALGRDREFRRFLQSPKAKQDQDAINTPSSNMAGTDLNPSAQSSQEDFLLSRV